MDADQLKARLALADEIDRLALNCDRSIGPAFQDALERAGVMLYGRAAEISAALRSTPQGGDQGAEATKPWPRKPEPPPRCQRDLEWIREYRRNEPTDLKQAIREHDAAIFAARRSPTPLPDTHPQTAGGKDGR